MKISSNTVITAVIGCLYVFTPCDAAKKGFHKKKLRDQSVYTNENDRFLGDVLSASTSFPDDEDEGLQYVFQFSTKKSLIESQDALASSDMTSTVLMTMGAFNMEVVKIGSEKELDELMANENVVFAEPDQKRYLLNPLPKQTGKYLRRKEQDSEVIPYGINLVKALDVSDELVGNMKVCIIDTGYDITHEDLPDGSNVGGNNNAGNRWDEDGNGHGTHVAGTIAAIGNNGVGVVGVNRNGNVGLHIERLFGNNGRPIFGSTIIGLAQKCVDAGSDIISMSLGGPFRMETESQAFENLYKERNVLVVAAAGNSGNSAYSYPASYDSVMSVAAIDKDSDLAFFSQRNDQVDISAPGVDVLSTKTGGGYVAYSGTSMACPHVAGVGALVWSHFPGKTSEDIRKALTASADDLGNPGRDDEYGYGLVNADRAFKLLNGDLTLAPTAAPTPQRPCNDDPLDFSDSRGNSCDWYAGGLFLNRCLWFASSRGNDDGVTANDACCTCDGGTFESIKKTTSPTVSPTETSAPSLSPTASPTASPTTTVAPSSSPIAFPTAGPSSAPTECKDVEGWTNSWGSGCSSYGYWGCKWFGDSFENDGLTANDACCVCK